MKIAKYTLLSLTLLLTQGSKVLADGGLYIPYNPYNPYFHPPVDTGLINDPIYFLGIVFLVSGFLLLINAKSLLTKLELR